jgi:hypothetical protein
MSRVLGIACQEEVLRLATLAQGIRLGRMACHERSSRFAEGKRELSRMVEAAGVEPASENTSSQSPTCVSPFSCRDRLETEPSAPAAIPDISHRHASGRNVTASLLNDDQSRAVGTPKLIAHWFLSSESVVCVRSYVVFPRDLRGAWASARVPRSRTPVEAKSPPWRVETANYFSSLLVIGCRCGGRVPVDVDTHFQDNPTHADEHRD